MPAPKKGPRFGGGGDSTLTEMALSVSLFPPLRAPRSVSLGGDAQRPRRAGVRSGRGSLGDHQRVLVGPLDLAGLEGGHEALERLGQLRLTVEREGGVGAGPD